VLRYSLRWLATLLPALLLAHALGYAYGHMVAPLHAARNPLYATQFDQAPLVESYGAYLGQALRGDLGPLPGARDEARLAETLSTAALNSLGLLSIALMLSIALGLSLGMLAVRDNPPRIAPWLTGVATLGLATPSFYFGVLGISAVILFLIYGPGQVVLLPLSGYGWGRHLVLPVLALMLRPSAQIAQMTAGMLVAELGKPYVVTARSFGVSEQRIHRRHVLRNAMPAIIATIAGALRLSAGELIIVETLFVWPGLGRLIAQALIPSNNSVVAETALFLSPPLLGATLALFAALFMLSNLVAGLAQRALDPRSR
jgi:peptide/nickel transport system permease protein